MREPPVVSPAPSRVYVHGKIYDLEQRTVVAELGGAPRLAVQDERDVLVMDRGELRAIDLLTTRERWHSTQFCWNLALAGDQVYCVSGAGLATLDRATGQERWHHPGPSPDDVDFAHVAFMADGVAWTDDDGTHLLAAADGHELAVDGLDKPLAAVNRVGAGFCVWLEEQPSPIDVRCCQGVSCRSFSVARPPGHLDGRWSLRDTGGGFVLAGDGAAVAVDLASGAQQTLDDFTAVVRDAGGRAAGFLSGAVPALAYHDGAGAPRPLTDVASDPDVVSAARADAGRLYVPRYRFMSVGAGLQAFDRATGALVWSADVEMWPVDHSKYFNRIELELRGDHVLLWGHESSNDYLQVFDARTGKREFVDRTDR